MRRNRTMMRGVLVLSAVALACFAAPTLYSSYDELPEEYRKLVPEQAKDFIKSLTDDDKKVLRELVSDYDKYNNEEELLAALKEKSPALHEKAEKLHKLVKEKVDALGEEAKAFAKEIIEMARKIQKDVVTGNKPSVEELKNKLREVIEKYQKLSPEAKEDLEKQFPITAAVLKNEKFQEIAKKMLAVKQN